jgi:hypothetical protein
MRKIVKLWKLYDKGNMYATFWEKMALSYASITYEDLNLG